MMNITNKWIIFLLKWIALTVISWIISYGVIFRFICEEEKINNFLSKLSELANYFMVLY